MKWLVAAFVFLVPVCIAQTVTPIVQPHVTFVDANGSPCSACSLYSYTAGTTTPQATYTDSTGMSQNTNPIVLDAAGGAQIWMGSNAYKFILKDASGSTIWSVDNVSGYFPLSGGTLSGPMNAPAVNNIVNANLFSGADCGAKINSALMSAGGLNGGSGIVQVGTACGATISTAVTTAAGQIIRFIQGGTWTVSAQITLAGNASGIDGLTCRQGWVFGAGISCPVVLKTSGALAQTVLYTGTNESVSNIEMDGNSAGVLGVNVTGTPGSANSAMRGTLEFTYIHGFTSHGLKLSGTLKNNEPVAFKGRNNTIANNGGDGVLCQGASDTWWNLNEFESNAANGFEFSSTNGCQAARINHNDFGGNAVHGILMNSASFTTAFNSENNFITGNQFGGQGQDDILINGWVAGDSAVEGYNNIIGSNQFIGLCITPNCKGSTPTANEYPAIHLIDTAYNSLTGNIIDSGPGSSTITYSYGVRDQQTNAAVSVNSIVGNVFSAETNGNLFGTASYLSDNALSEYSSNQDTATAGYYVMRGLYIPSGIPLIWRDSGGAFRNVMTLTGSQNWVTLFGHPLNNRINMSPDPAFNSAFFSGPLDTNNACGGGCTSATFAAPTSAAYHLFFFPNNTRTHDVVYATDGSITDFNSLTSEDTYLTDASDNWTFPKLVKATTLNVVTGRKGTFICTGGGTITISNANYAATSDVIITMNTAGGTISTPPAFKTVTPTTGFTVFCGAADTSTYNYTILN